MPIQQGKVVLITGANRGLGFEIALQFARKKATLILGCRSVKKGEEALRRIKKESVQPVDAHVFALDLTDLNSVQHFAQEVKAKFTRLDILIHNAAVVSLPEKINTPQGTEMHMATNHYGPFALTGHLYALLVQTPSARVVTMSSGAYRFGDLDIEDMNWEKRPYKRVKAYGASKWANLLFAYQLQKKFEQEGINAYSVAAHPGLSGTERQQSTGMGGWFSSLLAQPVWMGALPALRAATDSQVNSFAYYGPRYGMRGYPRSVHVQDKAKNPTLAAQLWAHSVHATGVDY